MNQFLLSLPAILGLVGFVIYLILRKSVTQDPTLKTILDKVKLKSPGKYSEFKSLSIRGRERLVKEDMDIKRVLSLEELKLLDKGLSNQYRTNIFVYSLCAVL